MIDLDSRGTTREWPEGGPPRSATAGADDRVRGQMAILFAVMATALLAFVALTIDGGYAFANRRSMQNAADAGSLAGTRTLASYNTGNPISDLDVSNAVRSAARSNGWSSATGAIDARYITTNRVPLGTVGSFGLTAPPVAARGVQVTATTSFTTFFGGFIGINTLTAQADARSIFGYSCSASCLLPVTVYTQTFVPGATYDFYGSNAGPGQFGWLNFSGGSSVDLCNDLVPNACTSGSVSQYGWVAGSSGNNWPSCVEDANRLPSWVGRTATIAIFGPGPGVSPGTTGCQNGDTLCNTNTCTSTNCPCTASCGNGSNFNYHIVGFGSFRITNYSRSDKTIQGTFVNLVGNSELSPGCSATSGIAAVNLIR